MKFYYIILSIMLFCSFFEQPMKSGKIQKNNRDKIVLTEAEKLELSMFKKLGFDVPKNKVTSTGTPIIEMWKNEMPDNNIEGAGFPLLKNAEHAQIFHAKPQSGGYNHQANLFFDEGTFFGSWSNHSYGEDSPGQRILYSTSTDGLTWTNWDELFPSPDKVKKFDETGYYLAGPKWIKFEKEVYAIATLYFVNGFESADRKSHSIIKDSLHIYKSRINLGRIARKVNNNDLGPIFSLDSAIDTVNCTAIKILASKNGQIAEQSANIQKKMNDINIPHINHRLIKSVDSVRLVEPIVYAVSDKVWVGLMRDDRFSHRMYVSISMDKGNIWTKAWPTNIPDSPSLTTSIKTDESKYILIGNQCASEFDNPSSPRHYKRNPLTVATSKDGFSYDRVYALRTGMHDFRIPDVKGRGGGAQYPSALIHNKKLYVMYSFGKEDIWCSIVPLSDL